MSLYQLIVTDLRRLSAFGCDELHPSGLAVVKNAVVS
jgi:hypothetical protein